MKSKKVSMRSLKQKRQRKLAFGALAIFAVICGLVFVATGTVGHLFSVGGLTTAVLFAFPAELGLTDKEKGAFDTIGKALETAQADFLKTLPVGITQDAFDKAFGDFKTKFLEDNKPAVTKEMYDKLEAAMKEQGRVLAEKTVNTPEKKLSVAAAIVKFFEEKGITSNKDITKDLLEQEFELKADNPLSNTSWTGDYGRTQAISSNSCSSRSFVMSLLLVIPFSSKNFTIAAATDSFFSGVFTVFSANTLPCSFIAASSLSYISFVTAGLLSSKNLVLKSPKALSKASCVIPTGSVFKKSACAVSKAFPIVSNAPFSLSVNPSSAGKANNTAVVNPPTEKRWPTVPVATKTSPQMTAKIASAPKANLRWRFCLRERILTFLLFILNFVLFVNNSLFSRNQQYKT
jgi:hypothetical protein